MDLFRRFHDEWRVRQLVALQLRSGKPPEVRAAFDRLLATGLASGHARRLALLPDRMAFDEPG